MTAARQMKLAAHGAELGALFSASDHPIRRKYDLTGFRTAAQLLEEAKFDAIFEADPLPFDLAGVNSPSFGPQFAVDATALVASIAAVTERIGVVTTASTTFNNPYHLARQFQTLDHLSAGRFGWNAVTSFGGEKQFGFAELPDQEFRYERAQEFIDVVLGLWQGWAADAVFTDEDGETRVDTSKVEEVHFHGAHLNADGALGIPRSPQGWPVLFQAGASEAGLRFAGRNAEAIYSASPDLDQALSFADRLAAATTAHRGPEAARPLILTGCHLITAATEEQAREREHALVAGLDFEGGRASLALTFGATLASDQGGANGIDLSDLDLDEPIPAERITRLPSTETLARRRSRPALYRALALRGLTVRELIVAHLQGHAHYRLVASHEQVADEFERWFALGAADGFVINFIDDAEAVHGFVEEVVPRLQQRGLFRREYEGDTLREHLGLTVTEPVQEAIR
jgi:FMN-dependent oxidoreductase (nitrilotriacetate monooxygenase family)